MIEPTFDSISEKLGGWFSVLARRYSEPPALDPEELMQEALMILSSALTRYKKDYNLDPGTDDFISMLKTEVRHRMIDLVRTVRSQRRDVKATITGHSTEDREFDLWDQATTYYRNPVEELIEREYFNDLLSKLTKDERTLLEAMLNPPKEFQVILAEYEKTQTRVRRNKPCVWIFGQALGWSWSRSRVTWTTLHKKLLGTFEETPFVPVRSLNGSRCTLPERTAKC